VVNDALPPFLEAVLRGLGVLPAGPVTAPVLPDVDPCPPVAWRPEAPDDEPPF
jgi:hypothetical protein